LSRPPDSLDDLEEAIRRSATAQQAQLWTALPGIVTAVDLYSQTLSVQPAIQAKVTDEKGDVLDVNLPLLVDVPIVWPRAGGFALTLPVAVDDEILVIFASRCIDSWWQSGGIGAQAELRMHDLSDGFAVLAPTSQVKKLSNVSPTNVQLRNEAGDTFLEINPTGQIKILATTSVEIEAPNIDMRAQTRILLDAPQVSIDGTLSQSGGAINLNPTLMTVNGPATFNSLLRANSGLLVYGGADLNGDVTVYGNQQNYGELRVSGYIYSGAINLRLHRHGGLPQGAPPGSFITGIPIN